MQKIQTFVSVSHYYALKLTWPVEPIFSTSTLVMGKGRRATPAGAKYFCIKNLIIGATS